MVLQSLITCQLTSAHLCSFCLLDEDRLSMEQTAVAQLLSNYSSKVRPKGLKKTLTNNGQGEQSLSALNAINNKARQKN